MIAKFLQDEDGATAIEYGMIVMLIAVLLITALSNMGSNLTAVFGKASTAIEGANGGA